MRNEDKNSKFFHASTSTRRTKNKLNYIINGDGSKVENHDWLLETVGEYFKHLFLSQNININPINGIVSLHLAEEDNNFLTSNFFVDEFKEVVFHMHPNKLISRSRWP